MSKEMLQKLLEVRRNPLLWFQGFGFIEDRVTREAIRSKATPLQKRMFEHYRRCQEEGRPCRMVVLKGRRSGGSTASSCLIYMHAKNHRARLGQLGTNYRASANMLAQVKHYGRHDDFPGWMSAPGKDGFQVVIETVPFEDTVEKCIETKIVWPHGSSVELYTAENPESARSAGLQGFHATETARWPTGGEKDAGETLNAMIKTVPKRGFTLIVLESTANGAQGAFYELCKSARWPEYADWWKRWEASWPQNMATVGPELQFTLIFSAWYEDPENVLSCTPEEERHIRDTLTEDENELIKLYAEDGLRGKRLGSEVDATVWEQLKWRRATIEHECKQRGVDEFRQEYPSSAAEAFLASGSPVLDREGLAALEVGCRGVVPDYGALALQNNGRAVWQPTAPAQALFHRWETPVVGARYLITVDPMTGEEQVTSGTGERDRHSVLVLRDAMNDIHGRHYPVKVVARVTYPCQLETGVLARQIALLSTYYGRATIVVEGNAGSHLIAQLRDKYNANLFLREVFDHVRQKVMPKLGFWTDTASRRVVIGELQTYVREQLIEVLCPHVISELKSLVFNKSGKPEAGGKAHDDDAMALAIGLTCLASATQYAGETKVTPEAPDLRRWKVA